MALDDDDGCAAGERALFYTKSNTQIAGRRAGGAKQRRLKTLLKKGFQDHQSRYDFFVHDPSKKIVGRRTAANCLD